MQTKQRILGAVGLLILVAALAACGALASSGATPAQKAWYTPAPAGQPVAHAPSGGAASTYIDVDASWAIGYSDFRTLKRDADVAVVGVITAAHAAPSDAAPSSTSGPANALPFTDSTLRVERVAYDPHPAFQVGATLTIHQTGGVANGVEFQVHDDPLLALGERVLVFLHEYAPGKYYVIGGPTGRFEVAASGAVSALSPYGVKLAPGITLDALLPQVLAA